VRQEWISPYKLYFQRNYKAYHGVADLFVYFYELGMRVLKPEGRLSFIVTNKWMKAGFGEPLRRFFAEHAWVESVVDFGHAKQIFEDADVFPCIIVARKPSDALPPSTARICSIPREQLRMNDLSTQIALEGVEVERKALGKAAWQLEGKDQTDLLARIKARGTPLSRYAGLMPLSGIKTGFNDAFLIDTATKQSLIRADPNSAEIIKPYLRGQDIKRWHCDWNGLWMISMKSSADHQWPWSNAGEQAEQVFGETYPSVSSHLRAFEANLKKRQDMGIYWWELRSCAYWNVFSSSKIMYQEITWKMEWCFDTGGTLCNNTAYILPIADFWVLAALNAPVSWWYAWRTALHGKDEALRFIKNYVQDFPVPTPSADQAESAQELVKRLIQLRKDNQSATRALLDWLKVQHEVPESSTKLQNPIALDSDGLIAEVRKVRGKKKPLSLAAVRDLREEHARTIEPAQSLAAEARRLERQVSDLVNEAYGLSADEVRLIWETAPPRMPIAPPDSLASEG
jgi:hypothetical protein